MGIGVQGEACGEASQHARYDLDVYSILEHDGCESVAKVMEFDFRNVHPCYYSFQHIFHTVR